MDRAAEKTARSRFQRRRFGVFDLAYEDPAPPSLTSHISSLLDEYRTICKRMPYARRLFTDTIRLAPLEFTAYVVATIWQSIYEAINLYLMSIMFDKLGGNLIGGTMFPQGCGYLATSWISCLVVNIVSRSIHTRSLELLTKRFRAYFMPLLISASLRTDLPSIQNLHSIFPISGRFEAEFPGGCFLTQLSLFVECNLGLASQVLVLVHVISRKQSPEREVLFCLLVARGLVMWLALFGGLGRSAFVYWPNNLNFKRMKTLFGLAFSTQHRADLVLDGIAGSIETEYKKSAERLGDIEILDPNPWRSGLARDWYWDFLLDMTWNLPMAAYALMSQTHLSSLSIASIALLQQASRSVSYSIGTHTEARPSLASTFYEAQLLYDAIDYQSTMPRGTEPFPHPTDRSYDAGMKISFRHVSLRYPGRDCDALHDISFEIQPGQLVLVVGTNGSGKSSLLKLLARLFDPTAGEIFVNDLPLLDYDMDQLRAAMTFQPQAPVVYPVTVRENIAFSLPPTFSIKQQYVEEAVQMGNCSEWILRLSDGYNTKVQSSFDINFQWVEGMYGHPSEALKEELARHQDCLVSISDGEKQRLATARTFMRINNTTTRLVVVDEATSSLDPIAERDIMTEFRKVREGKTILVVTHRFYHLAHEADLILCMKGGCIVESGTHAKLVQVNGVYSTLYRAQAECTD